MKSATDMILARQRAEIATKDDTIARLREALDQGEKLIDGPLVGVDWKRECRSFLKAARAALESSQ